MKLRTPIENERIDEALELIWLLREDNRAFLSNFKASSDDESTEEIIRLLIEDGLVNIKGEEIDFTEKGYERARGLIRRYRLAERLFSDVFELRDDLVKDDACRVEHILSNELTDSVCTFLGHPPTCPHGKPIPRGECCKKYRVDVEPLITRLSSIEPGTEVKIVFIVPSQKSSVVKLSSMGIIPGVRIRLLQKKPTIILQVEETVIAIDPEIADEILVRKVA
ncbi:MAG: metal-dependent transcriptional regulator [Thermodesulfovibrionales bacterium]